MWYYNQNQIIRMKIDKNEFKTKLTNILYPEELIHKVLYQFEPNIDSKSLTAYIIWGMPSRFKMKQDWDKFQLIIFNILQNAVKYNKFEGSILIILDCLPVKYHDEDEDSLKNYIFEVEIIDTGIGISEERQNMLFQPFMELKIKQNLKKVKDNNIGMGLACSHAICREMGGDMGSK